MMTRQMSTARLTDMETANTRVLTEPWAAAAAGAAAAAVTNSAGRLTTGGNSVTLVRSVHKYTS